MDVFLVTDNRVFNRPLAHSLCIPPLGYAHSLCSLPLGRVKNHEYVFTLKTRSTGRIAFVLLTRNTPFKMEAGIPESKQEEAA